MEVTFKKKNKNIKEDVRINLQQQLKNDDGKKKKPLIVISDGSIILRTF